MSENFIAAYDLESLTEEQRQQYIKNVCAHMGVPDNLNLVALTRIDDGEGPSRLVAYAKRGATENVRNNLQIDVTSLTSIMVNGSIVFTATAVSKKTGRQEISTGAKYIDGLTGTPLDDALMTAQTRALRRVTLQFVGAGVLDESEVHQGRTVKVAANPSSVISLAAPQPTVAVSQAAGKDITDPDRNGSYNNLTAPVEHVPETPEQYQVRMDKLRADAIAHLNGTVTQNPPKEEVSLQPVAGMPEVDPVKKPRKPRGPNKPKVNMGESVAPPASPAPSVQPATAPVTFDPVATITPDVLTHPNGSPAMAPVPAPAGKPRLSPEQVKPYRQRLFKIVNDHLEPNGFAPKEGMGNADKMRNLAGIMFSDVTNLAELTEGQWETYLTTLESKIKTLGAKATIEYIEGTIGL